MARWVSACVEPGFAEMRLKFAQTVLGQQISPLLFAWSLLHLARGPVLLVLKAKILDTLLKTNSERVY